LELETEKQIELESEELMSEHRARRRNTKKKHKSYKFSKR